MSTDSSEPADPDTPSDADLAAAIPDPRIDAHRDDGLELARALTRGTASTAAPRRRSSRPFGDRPRRTRARVSGARPDDRDPQLLDGVVARMIEDHGWADDLRVRGLFARWPELVGAQVADHAAPESYADGKLIVRTDSTAWATQLRLLAPTVVRRLNEELGHGTITLLEVVGPQGPSWKKGKLSVRGARGPRDTYG